ncbi:helix-turn-helix domain-containing protein [Rhodoferax sp.]|uniref:helix-turn-helix domain-containing protein n=1 Tax=Rhodoferax sp. TaxID=50421 RepID=UPI00374CB83F
MPLPFVVALVLVYLLAQMTWRQGVVVIANRRFRLLLGGYALLSTLVGMRWAYDVKQLLPLQATLAVCLAPWSWYCYQTLAGALPSLAWRIFMGLPALLMLGLVRWWPAGIDALVVLVFLGYGLALLRLARRGPDALGLARLDEALLAHRALIATAAILLVSALVDVFIAWDMRSSGGSHSAALVGSFQLFGLLLWGTAASVAGQSLPDVEPSAALRREEPVNPLNADSPAPDLAEDQRIVAVLHGLMQQQQLYLELDLNLLRMARKSGIPARQISAAVNRVEGKNVSQYVNDFRVGYACRLLRETAHSVTDVMLASGFQTKSNFQREFRRVTGTTPLLWREQAAGSPA